MAAPVSAPPPTSQIIIYGWSIRASATSNAPVMLGTVPEAPAVSPRDEQAASKSSQTGPVRSPGGSPEARMNLTHAVARPHQPRSCYELLRRRPGKSKTRPRNNGSRNRGRCNKSPRIDADRHRSGDSLTSHEERHVRIQLKRFSISTGIATTARPITDRQYCRRSDPCNRSRGRRLFCAKNPREHEHAEKSGRSQHAADQQIPVPS